MMGIRVVHTAICWLPADSELCRSAVRKTSVRQLLAVSHSIDVDFWYCIYTGRIMAAISVVSSTCDVVVCMTANGGSWRLSGYEGQ